MTKGTHGEGASQAFLQLDYAPKLDNGIALQRLSDSTLQEDSGCKM